MQPQLDYNGLAQTLIAGLSATMQAIQTWLQFRDRRRADEDFKTLESARTADVERQALAVVALIPQEVLRTLAERAEKCWLKYHNVIGAEGKYMDSEIDEATEAVKQCICRELRRIKSLNGNLPAGIMQEWWDAYKCGEDKAPSVH